MRKPITSDHGQITHAQCLLRKVKAKARQEFADKVIDHIEKSLAMT